MKDETSMLSIEQVFSIVKAVYAGEGYVPDGTTTREQRNGMWDAALACVHYGHPVYNPAGGDTRWMNKKASPTSPATDDVVVFAPTRAYWDFIIDSGANTWRFNLGAHDETLPTNQVLFAPDVRALPPVGGPPPPPTPPTPPPPTPPETNPLPPDADLADATTKLEAYYRDKLGRGTRETAVDVLGYGRWIGFDYVYTRGQGRSHDDALNAMFTNIEAITGVPR